MAAEMESDIVTVNAGGTRFETTLRTLKVIDFVHAKWNFEKQAQADGGGENSVFIDVNPQVFEAVLELARGKGPRFLQGLDAPLQARVRQQMQEWHMDTVPGFNGFLFELVKTPFVVVMEAKATPGRKTVVSRGLADPMDSTILGSKVVPEKGVSYFEVEVLRRGEVQKAFALGVAEEAIKRDTYMHEGQAALAVGICVTGPWVFRVCSTSNPGTERTNSFPKIERGSRIGVYIDMDVGQVAFFVDGKLRLIHTQSVAGRKIYPALTVAGDTVLQLHAGMEPPSTEDALVLD